MNKDDLLNTFAQNYIDKNEIIPIQLLTTEELAKAEIVKNDAVIGSLDEIIAEREKRIGPVDRISKMFLSEMAAGIYENKFLFINTDMLSEVEIPYALHHEAVESVFHDDQDRARTIITQLDLNDITQLDTWNQDRPEHFVAMYEEIRKSKEDGVAEIYIEALFKRVLNELDEYIIEYKDRARDTVKTLLITMITRLKILQTLGIPFPPSAVKVHELTTAYF